MVLNLQKLCTYAPDVLQYTTDTDSSSRLKSVTQERDLDEFLNTATLAGLEFTAGQVTFKRSIYFFRHER